NKVFGQNSALHFDGTNDYIDFPSSMTGDNESQTVEFWFKYTSLNSTYNMPIFMRGNDAGSGSGWNWQLQLNRTTQKLDLYGAGYYLTPNPLVSTNSLSTNTWYHIAVVHNLSDNTDKIYINGVLNGTTSLAPYLTSVPTFRNDAEGYQFGPQNVPSTYGYINQFIDEIRIWNVARTQSEIQNNMNGMNAPF
ncbi:MAG: LamG domain-containing protein, partial [Bacteroidia bacterium]|nr:LamG domain-containing protein [Bacteroidia bacterium]